MLTQPVIFILIGLQAAVLAPAPIDPITRGENDHGDVNDDKVDKLIDIVKQQLEAQMLLLKTCICCRVCDKDVETDESLNKHPASSQLPQAHGEVTPIKMSQNPIYNKPNQKISTSASAQDTEHFTVTELSEFENKIDESPSDDAFRTEYDLNRSSPQTTGKSSRQWRMETYTSPRRKIQKSTPNNIKVKKSTSTRTKVKKTSTPHSNLGHLYLSTVKPIKVPVRYQMSGHWLFPHNIKPKVAPVDVTQGPNLELEVVQNIDTMDPAQVEEGSILPGIVEDESVETEAGFSIFPDCGGDCPTFPEAFSKVEEESILPEIVEDESAETDEARRGRKAELNRGPARYDKTGF